MYLLLLLFACGEPQFEATCTVVDNASFNRSKFYVYWKQGLKSASFSGNMLQTEDFNGNKDQVRIGNNATCTIEQY